MLRPTPPPFTPPTLYSPPYSLSPTPPSQPQHGRRYTPAPHREVPERRGLSQGYLAYKKTPPPRTLQYASSWGPMAILGGWAFLTREVPLHGKGADRISSWNKKAHST